MNKKLRVAQLKDALLLLEWRNDSNTRQFSHTTEIINKEDHINWLSNVITNTNRELYIYEENNIPLGTVRADLLENGEFELSWTVAPSARGKGVAKKMVEILSKRINGTIVAEIKESNIASSKIAEHIGMKLTHIQNGIKYYKRD